MRLSKLCALALISAVSCTDSTVPWPEPLVLRAQLASYAQTLHAMASRQEPKLPPSVSAAPAEELPPAQLAAKADFVRRPSAVEPTPWRSQEPYPKLEPLPPMPPPATVPAVAPPPEAPPPLVPLADREEPITTRAPDATAVNAALGVGGAGLVVSAITVAANIESSSDSVFVVSGVALGIGVVGLATAGILTLMQEPGDEEATAKNPPAVTLRPTAGGFELRF